MIDAVDARDVRSGGRWSSAQRRKNDAIYAAVRTALWLADRAPAALLLGAGRCLGLLSWALLCFRQRGRRTAFVCAGENLALCILLRRYEVRALDWLECGSEAVDLLGSALAEGRGAIVVSAHLGAFELVPAAVAELGHRPAVIVRESYDCRLDPLVDAHRVNRGITVIHRGRTSAGLRAVRALMRGQPLGVLPDLPGRVERVCVRLLGRRAELAVGPARLARLTGAPLLVATASRPHGAARHHLRLRKIIVQESDDEARLMQRVADELSRAIGEAPHQWLGSVGPF